LGRELLAGYHVTARRAIPQVCGPDRSLQIAMGIRGKELVVVGRDIVGRSGILRRVKKLLLEIVVCRRGRG
jgi:hypothetical protein